MRRALVLGCCVALLLEACGGDDFKSVPSVQKKDAAMTDSLADSPSSSDGPLADANLETAAPEPAQEAGPEPAPEAGSEASVDAQQEDSGPPCQAVTRNTTGVEDTVIVNGGCNGANCYGNSAILNIGAGRGVFRFLLDADSLKALQTNPTTRMELTLSRNTDCEGSGGCPAAPGKLEVYPLRTDWVAGDGGKYSGADWCRRTDGNPGEQWGDAGATASNVDHGKLLASAEVTKDQPTVVFGLGPGTWDAKWIEQAKRHISILVIPKDSVKFVAASFDSQMHPSPLLQISWCQ